MANALSNPIPWLVGGAVLALAGAFLRQAGSAMVIDETGGVASAVITDSGGNEQRLHRVWSGYFYAIPDMEGTIEIRCRNGVRKQWGYVTGHRHTKIRVVGPTPCARVIEDD